MKLNHKLLSGKDFRRLLPGLFISFGLLGIVFSSVNFVDLGNAFKTANYWYVPFAVVIFLLSMVARAVAWRILLQKKATITRVFITLNEGYLLNNVIPFRLGEIGRAFLLSRTASISFWQVLSTIMIERIFDILMVVGILLTTIPLVAEIPQAGPKAILIGGSMLLGLTVLHILAKNKEKSKGLLNSLQKRISVLRLIKAHYLDRFFNGLDALTDIRQFMGALIWMAIAWFLVILQYYLILLAFLPGAKFVWAGFGIGMVGLGVAVPSAPGGVGVVEATLVFVFGLFGVKRSIALAYSLLVHSIYLIVTSALGLYGLIIDGESLSRIVVQIRSKNALQTPSADPEKERI